MTTTPPQPQTDGFERLARLAAAAFDAPLGLVSRVGAESQGFFACVGLDAEASVPLEASFCARAVAEGRDLLVVEDALEDPRFRDYATVTGEPNVRFYAGALFRDPEGRPVGAVAVADFAPRGWPSAAQVETLRELAGLAGDMLRTVDLKVDEGRRRETLEMAESMAGVGHFRVDVASGAVTWSDEVYRIHGFEPGAVDPTEYSRSGAYDQEDAVVVRALIGRAVTTGEGYDARLRLTRADGEQRVTRSKARCERDGDGRVSALFGVFQDITETVRATEALERSEGLFRLMTQTATDIIARYLPDGTFLYLSPSVETVLGHAPGELIGKNCADIIHPDDREPTFARMASVVLGPPDTRAHVEYRAVRADGSVVWLEASPRLIRDAEGRVMEVHDHVRDISRRKDAEREQAEMLDTLKLAETVAGVGHWRLDIASQRVAWSDEVYRIHGVDPDTFDPNLSAGIDFYHPDDREAVTAWVGQAIETGTCEAFRMRLIRADGEERIVSSQGVLQRDDEGRPVALFGVFQDVTAEVAAHRAVAASEARYRLLADNATDVIGTYTPDCVFTWVSPAAEAVLGYRPEDMVGKSTLRFVHPDDRPAALAAFQAYVAAGPGATSPVVSYRALAANGEPRWMEAHPLALYDDDGRLTGFQDIVRDVSAQKALQDALVEARDRAEEAARAKSEFLANMSHELRTPLTSVIGFSGLLQASEALGPMERRYADRIGTASEALLSVINDILDYSKLGAGAVEMDPQPIDVAAWARGAVEMIDGQCQKKGLSLTLVVAPEVPPRLVGDEGRLRQVLLNFLSNACKFTAEGVVSVAISAEAADAGARLRVAVTDSGIGIAPDKIDVLFDRFTQADQSTTRTYGGTGLGLAISRRLIELMGGEVGVESQPGQGSTFWFEVPLPIDADGAGDARAQAAMDAAAVAPGARILVADDAPANRDLVSTLLTGLGLEVETVGDGAEAVEALRRGGHDLVLMDVHMPGLDGLAATRAIRALAGPVARTPVIALTANVQPEKVARCREAGMDDHVGKPINVAELVETLGRHLRPAAQPSQYERSQSA